MQPAITALDSGVVRATAYRLWSGPCEACGRPGPNDLFTTLLSVSFVHSLLFRHTCVTCVR
jgi:hypothetical protein